MPGISAADYQSFYKNGYLRIPSLIPPLLMNRLTELFEELMDTRYETGDRVVIHHNGKDFVTNLENLCCKGNLSCLELLAYPPILRIAETICGPDFFLIQEFAVNKNRGDELPVLWHQDMVHQRSGNCFTMGIYLDDAAINDGALKVVLGSHLDNRSICELSKEPFIQIPMQAGDALIHDMMLAHCSDPLVSNPVRRVIYFEFLSAAHARKENIYTDELINRRSRLLFTAFRHYGSIHQDETSFIYEPTNPFPDDDKKDIALILNEIYSQPVQARPSAYCFEHSNPPGS